MEQYQQVLHPWHISIGDNAPEIITAVIEIYIVGSDPHCQHYKKTFPLQACK